MNKVSISQAVILCGGLGSRLKPHTDKLPKPMIPVNGEPFLLYLLKQLSEKGLTSFLLLTGYLGEQIVDYFGDGSKWGWDINYSSGPVEWDTGRRLIEAKGFLDSRFMLLYSDNYVNFSLEKLLNLHESQKKEITLMLSSKKPGNIQVNGDGEVMVYDKTRSEPNLNFVEIGYMIIDNLSLWDYYKNRDISFSDIIQLMVQDKKVSAIINDDNYHSISDPDRWKKTERFLAPKRILLLDRDGVLNEKAKKGEYIENWQKFNWIEDSLITLKYLSKLNFRFIVITNQAGIARGMVDQAELSKIHQNMIESLAKSNVEIIDINCCPHHWDDDCLCRKPKPGMLLQAAKDHYIDLNSVLYIGDDIRDCQAAYNANCKSVFIGDKSELAKLKREELPMFNAQSLQLVQDQIIAFYENSSN